MLKIKIIFLKLQKINILLKEHNIKELGAPAAFYTVLRLKRISKDRFDKLQDTLPIRPIE